MTLHDWRPHGVLPEIKAGSSTLPHPPYTLSYLFLNTMGVHMRLHTTYIFFSNRIGQTTATVTVC